MWLLSYSVLGLISPVFTLPLTKNYKLFNESPTVRLTAQNFAQEVNSSPNPWIIVIYSESSESCERYSKVGWPKLVKAIGEWEDKFSEIFGKNQMGAIEEGEGLFATNEYDFPIIKIFPPNSSGVPLSKKINWYSPDAMLEILLAIHQISKEEVLPKTSQEWTTRIDKIWDNWQKELALANKGEKVVLETYTQIIRTVTTTSVVNPFLLGLISPVFTLPLTKNYKLFNESPTVRLTAQNFAQKVNSSPNPWIIVIYSESSKLCKRYSNVGWPKLVKAIGEWEDKFSEIFGKNRMGAIEAGEGLFATNEYDFPIIKIFPPNSSGVPLSKKINWYSTDEMLEILLAIHQISKEEVLPKTSQEWTTRVDKIWNNWQKELALANEGERVVLETYTQVISTVTTTRVVNPFHVCWTAEEECPVPRMKRLHKIELFNGQQYMIEEFSIVRKQAAKPFCTGNGEITGSIDYCKKFPCAPNGTRHHKEKFRCEHGP
ncbi:unnamed protein product, partial [Mesorhabditis belari]|uniref:Thioredoxin domain-containing protein n=1 Tax=Mesorhabditis belari TaxID=2138241 RepID=A0AAF3JAN6_9BILA